MKKLILLLHFTFGIFCFTFSQTAPGIEWQNTIGGSAGDGLYIIQKTSDGGYILGGTSDSNISGDKTKDCRGGVDYWIVKVDSQGNTQWDNTFGGSADDELRSVEQTSDGGYILGGFSRSNISGDKTENTMGGISDYDYWIIKTDFNGNIQWQNTIGGIDGDYLRCIKQTSDGGYILGGDSDSHMSGDKTENCMGNTDYWIVKTDMSGNILWQNTIGGYGIEYLLSINQTTDGGYILAGSSDSDIAMDKTENCIGLADYWIVKTSSLGIIQWQNTIGGNAIDMPLSACQTSDGGYIVGGYSSSNMSGDKSENTVGNSYYDDYWVVKLDVAGNIQWQNTIGGNGDDILSSLEQTFDGDYILGGYSWSYTLGGDKTENNNGGVDYWIVKINSSGNILWQNTIGGNLEDRLSYIHQTNNGGYILGGYSRSNISGDKTENCLGVSDFWIIKLYPDTTTGIPNIQPATNNIQLFPNPTKDEITITGYTLQNNQPAQLKIFDVMGKQVLAQTVTTLNLKLKTVGFSSGIYYLQLNSGQQVTTARFVKM